MPEVQEITIRDTAAQAQTAAQSLPPAEDLQDMQGEKMVLNMGPSHPSTHGVLRIVLELDGEIITKAIPDVGYLHRGDEKIAENMTYTQFIPYTDRLDYLAPLANNVAYALAVEKLLGIHDKLPPRCQYIRVICCELARISSHLLGVGCFAMDVGAMTVFLLTFTEREKIYNLAEALSGAWFTTSYTRIGGVSRDTPPGWCEAVRKFINEVVVNINEVETLLTRNKIWVDRTKDVGVISRADAIDFGLSGPNLRGCGVNYDLRKDQPYLCYKDLQFDVPLGEVGDCYDRYLVRMEEMRQSCSIIRQALDRMPEGEVRAKVPKYIKPPAGEIYHVVESPRGEQGFYIVTTGGEMPYRMRFRAPSFVNTQALPLMCRGRLVADVVAIIGSIDVVLGDCDR
jgi:NADH-quinone oxidoreductase subunit D